MSTENTMLDSQTPPQLPELREPITAGQIETNCPDRLREIGKLIAARLEKIDKQIKQAEDHSISVNQLIAEAKELCDEGGFNAFQKMYFPDLGKSRVYELLAIGTNKRSAAEIRANTRARVAKHRAKRAAAFNSVIVTDKSKPEPYAQGAPNENGEIEAPGIASEQTPEASKPWTPNSATVADKSKPEPCTQGAPNENGEIEAPGIASKQTPASSKPPRTVASNDTMRIFTACASELFRVTNKKPAEHFSTTAIPAEKLAQLGSFFTKLANIKKSDAVNPGPTEVRPDDGNDPPAVIREQAPPESNTGEVASHEHV